MSSLYPSLEGMKIDQMMQVQSQIMASQQAQQVQQPAQPSGSVPSSPSTADGAALPYSVNPDSAPMYPGLGNYMGLELSEDVIRENMPEYLNPGGSGQPHGPSGATRPQGQVVHAPPSAAAIGGSSGLNMEIYSPVVANSQLSHNVRQVVLCKDAEGKIGLRVRHVDKGIFVCLVTRNSAAAMGGLRFGDQILQINGVTLAGFSESKVHDLFKKVDVNNIVLAVRDRPFQRTLTLHKDSTGHLGFQYNNGKITAIVVESSAARNGVLDNHNLLEVNGQNVVGIKDKEIAKIIDEGGQVVTVTVIPTFIYKHMMANMSCSLVKKMMDHSIPDF